MIPVPTSPVLRRRFLVAALVTALLAVCATAFTVRRWHSVPASSHPPAADVAAPNKLALEQLLYRELPLRLDATKIYPSRPVLPGSPFKPLPFDFTRQSLASPASPGDYTIPVVTFNLNYCELSPGAGVAYELGPLQGKAAEVISTLLWRGLASGTAPASLHPTVCAIQSGIPYGHMPGPNRETIDRFVPDLTETLSTDFLDSALKLYGTTKDISTASEKLRKALKECGPLGGSAMRAIIERNLLLRRDLSNQQRNQMIADGGSNGISTPTRLEDAPWTETVPGIVFMRLKLNSGSLVRGTLDLRIFPPREAQAASGAEQREPPTLMSLFGAKVAPDGSVRVTGLVGYPLAPQAWPVTIYPFSTR